MDHPHIAKVLDAGATADDRPYFVMEMVPGVPLTQFCDERRLSLRQRLELFIPVCQAVQHAHQKSIIHRDLKPSNVLVGLYDGQPVPKVIDFGIAKATGPKLTERTLATDFGAVVGTLEYMAPEQAELNSLDIDTRADIYSLGVLLYELLTGSTPRRGRLKDAALLEVLLLIREQEPERPSARLSSADTAPSVAAARGTEPAKLAKLVRGELDWIVLKCLEKDRDRRYETANGLARDLERYLADEPVAAGPPGAGYRLRKFVRRHRGPVLAAALVLLALLVGVGGTTWGLVRAEQARQAEADQRRLAEERQQVAEAKEQEARAVLDFFEQRVLAAVRPKGLRGGLGKDATIRMALDAAEPMIAQAFTSQPAVEAAIRNTLGETYHHLGESALAIAQLERALALRRQVLGPDHLHTLTTLNNLATAYQHAGKMAEAITLFEQARDALVKKLAADHPDALAVLHNLALAYRLAGRTAAAIALFERVRDVRVNKLGANHPHTLLTLHNLAGAYQAAGRTAEAIAIFEQVRDAQVKQLGADHPLTLTTLNNLATAYLDAGNPAEAVAIFEQVRDANVKQLGADHPDTLTTLHNLAVAWQVAGQTAEAIARFQQVRDARVKKLGADHPGTLATLASLAGAYRDAGKTSEAIALFEQVRDAMVKTFGADHPDSLACLNDLARAYQDAGKLEQALPLFQQAATGIEKRQFFHRFAGRIVANLSGCYEELKQYELAEGWRRKWLAVVQERAGPQSPTYAFALAALGQNLLWQQKYADAETTLRDSLALSGTKQGDWVTFYTRSLLGDALLGQRRYAEAEPLLLAGYEGLKQREATIPANAKKALTEALERLVQLYDAWGKKDQADQWRKQLLERAGPKAP
jgi:hypothetical protein